ncbi:uncharacterized, partial [Tachysurus ichikawai]
MAGWLAGRPACWKWKNGKVRILDRLSLPENDRGRLWDSPRRNESSGWLEVRENGASAGA